MNKRILKTLHQQLWHHLPASANSGKNINFVLLHGLKGISNWYSILSK
jgi:hypothetical protein